MSNIKTTVYCIFDGFGLLPSSINNCVSNANMPNFRSLLKDSFWTTLNADGIEVGQEQGLVGNSEVGHMNLGGLQKVNQLSYQITESSKKGFELDKTTSKDQIFDPSQKLEGQKKVHLVGLFSTGAIHSDMRHWLGAIQSCFLSGVEDIVLHLLTDGRDSDRKSFIESLIKFVSLLNPELKAKVRIGSIGGRAYAMDRDNNFDKVYVGLQAIFGSDMIEKTKDLRTKFSINEYKIATHIKEDLRIDKAVEYLRPIINSSYSKEIYDEFIDPLGFDRIDNGDAIWLINFRSDRMKQIIKMLCEYNQTDKDQKKNLILTMNDYGGSLDSGSDYQAIFKSQLVVNTFAYHASKENKSQLHTAETEKYNHVTFFFNGGTDKIEQGEFHELVNSNKLLNHSEKPEMKAKEIADIVINNLGKYHYIVVNFANPDMVGHCGDIQAGIIAMELLDVELGRILQALTKTGDKMLLTADHGNIEVVGKYQNNGREFTDTEHNPSPVPMIFVNSDSNDLLLEKITNFVNLNKINCDLDLLKSVLLENNRIENTEEWLKQADIPKPKLPLWYAGLIAYCL